jgi:hypothetical protein
MPGVIFLIGKQMSQNEVVGGVAAKGSSDQLFLFSKETIEELRESGKRGPCMLDCFCKVRHEIIDAVYAPGNTSAIEPINGWKTRSDGQKKSVIPDRRRLRSHGERRDRFNLVMACIARLVKPDPTSRSKLQKEGKGTLYLAINWQRREIETGFTCRERRFARP